MNTTTNTKRTLLISVSRSLSRHGTIQMTKQVGCKNDNHSFLSRWPAKSKQIKSASAVTTAPYNLAYNSDSTMKTLNLRKFVLVALGFFAVVLLGMTLIDAEGLNVAGEAVGYLAALAILGLAAMDNTGTKKMV